MTSKFASLYAGMLARKGEAVPAYSNPAVSYVDEPRPVEKSDADEVRRDVASADGLPLIADKMLTSRYHPATRALAKTGSRPFLRAVGTPAPREPIREGADEAHHGPYRFTFRMPAEQRRRLRVAAAQKDSSLQQSLCEALDKYLDGLCACSVKDCACLASADGPPLIADKAMAGRAGTRASAETSSPPPPRAVGTPAPREPMREDAGEEHHGPYRYTFRMLAEQHRRLRAAAAQKGSSLQQSLSDALDKYLDDLCACSLKDCACLARRDGGQRN